MRTTLFWSALTLLITSSHCLTRGVTAAEEETPGDSSASKTPPGQRVQVPIKGVEFYARSIRLEGRTVTATGDLRARLEGFPRVEIRAELLEYRIGGDKVRLREPLWTYPAGEEESRRLNVRAAIATFSVKKETITAKSIRVETQEGHVSLVADRGTWWSKSRECLLQSLQGQVFAVTDKRGKGSRTDAHFDFRVQRATVELSPELTLKEIRLERISGVERRDGYAFEAGGGTLDSWPGETLREARLTKVKVVGPQGCTIESDELTYRPPKVRAKK